MLQVLDLAEIPTYQARIERERLGRAAYARGLARVLANGLTLTLDGASRPLRELRHEISFPAGVGGLKTTRLELALDGGEVSAGTGPLSLAFTNRNFAARTGWREIVVRTEGGATLVDATVPSRSVSRELRAYPDELLGSPLTMTEARIEFDPGDAHGTAPVLGNGTQPSRDRGASASEGGFASLIEEESLSAGVILVSLLVAAFWGAAHALTPGHGKAIVAAYSARGAPPATPPCSAAS